MIFLAFPVNKLSPVDGSGIESRGATLTGRMTVPFTVLFAFTAPDHDDDDELFTAVRTTA